MQILISYCCCCVIQYTCMSLPTNEESFGQWLGLLIASEPGLWQGLESLLFYYMKDLSSNIFIISKVSNYMSISLQSSWLLEILIPNICDRKPQPETSSYDLNIKMEKYGKKKCCCFILWLQWKSTANIYTTLLLTFCLIL